MSNKIQTLEDLRLPVLPLRDVVVFPHMVIPLFVGRDKSINALDKARELDDHVFVVTQKGAKQDNPSPDDLHLVGTVASVLQSLELPNRNRKVLVEGLFRARVERVALEDGTFVADLVPVVNTDETTSIMETMMATIVTQFEEYVKYNQKMAPELAATVAEITSADQLCDVVASNLVSQGIEERQKILEMTSLRERLDYILTVLSADVELLQVEKRVRERVERQMKKSQKEYYLNEQMKAIQRELGNADESRSEFDELQEKIEASGMSKEAREKSEAELKKLRMMSPMAAEATVVRNYIDWLIRVPWKKRTRILKDLGVAEKILDEDHYGLEKVKERILEYLAVQKRVRKLKGPILCLVGPPGVGKTSLGQSVARATNRKFIRMSLGGVRDEAEIRGHRRTYVGSLPGKIIQNLAKVKVKNPLFMLDEVDKMSMDFRGDPSSALLEVLDPEQNHTFVDHYLEVDYDLSDIMFIATANTLNIPPPLLDRMEVIRISGYTEDEKIQIALQYLLPKQMKNNGVKKGEFSISRNSLVDIVRYYTREAGVRGLEREIAKIIRKVTRELVQNPEKVKAVNIRPKSLERYLGVRQFKFGRADRFNQVGQVTGLAWTETGGDLLSIEAVIVPGKGKHIYTGKLGNVMQESIQAAVSVVRSRAAQYGIKANFYQRKDIHVHVPEGATPKDGPSAGVAMCVAIISALCKIPVLSSVAMTGEITLRGEVLPIGGLKEKLLAAHRGGIETVLIPMENVKDLPDIPKKIKQDLEIIPVQWIDEVVKHALESMPESLSEKPEVSLPVTTELEHDKGVSVVTH